MDSAARPQDLPPQGGYKPIWFKRVPTKTLFSGKQLIGGYFAVSAVAIYVYHLTCKEVHQDKIEMRSAKNVIFTLCLAERDREYMKQLRRNRDSEAALMANVPGWVVGTWYGEPIYKTKPATEWLEPMAREFYVHAPYKDYARRAYLKFWT